MDKVFRFESARCDEAVLIGGRKRCQFLLMAMWLWRRRASDAEADETRRNRGGGSIVADAEARGRVDLGDGVGGTRKPSDEVGGNFDDVAGLTLTGITRQRGRALPD